MMRVEPLLLLLLLLPALVQGYPSLPMDCKDFYMRGERTSQVYSIHPDGTNTTVDAYCEMAGCEHREEGGGWTVFQRRVDGTLNFYRPWQQYKEGFGNASGEYWLGLDTLYQLTSRKQHQLRVDIEDFEGSTVYALYRHFSVGSEEEGYRLTVSGFKNRGAGDALSYHNGMNFTTFDRDQDQRSKDNCAAKHIGAFWYNNCLRANPNGAYLFGPNPHKNTGVVWTTFRNSRYSLKSITMLIRPVV